MSTITTAHSPTTMSAAATRTDDRATIRVGLREIREYAYRALIVMGASTGEATAASAQVLHAEIHTREGLNGLAADLKRGPWPKNGLSCTRDTETETVLHVHGEKRATELRIATSIIDLAAGEHGSAIVTTTLDIDPTPLLDEALLRAATQTSTTVAAINLRPGAPHPLRLATPAGELGAGLLDPATTQSLPRLKNLHERPRLIVMADATSLTSMVLPDAWSTPEERAARRRTAARGGLHVDAATWGVVAEYAHRFLVPEQTP